MSDRSSKLLLYVLPGVMLLLLAVVVWALWLPSSRATNPQPPAEEPLLQFAPGKGSLAGRVLLPDGSLYEGPGRVAVEVHRDSEEGSYFGGFNLPLKDGEFRGDAESGLAFATAYVDGYAAATVGPFENLAGGVIEDLELVLDPGKPLAVTVVDQQKKPITNATVKGGASIHGSHLLHGDHQGDGTYKLEHVGHDRFWIAVNVSGYEPQSVTLDDPFDEPIVIEMVKTLPTTGTVIDAEGNPLAHVVLHDMGINRELGRTDENGQLELTQLTKDDRYDGFMETPDGQRLRFDKLGPGQTGLTFQFPPPRQMTVTIRGGLEQLRNAEKQTIQIDQWVDHNYGDFTYSRHLHDNVSYIIENDEATLTFPGLVRSRIEFQVEGLPVAHDYDGVGDVHVEVDLDRSTFDIHEAP